MKGHHLLTGILARTARYLRQNALAAVALMVALGGTGYAATGLPSHSSTTRTPVLAAHGQVVAWALVNGNGRVVAGGPQPRTQRNGPGLYTVSWRGVPTSRTRKEYCASMATVDDRFSSPDENVPSPVAAGYATVSNRGHFVFVATFNPSGQPTPLGFEVALICPT